MKMIIQKGNVMAGRTIRKKIKPIYFEAVVSGQKKFELRYDDDCVSVGDFLMFEEYGSTGYTGCFFCVRVSYVLRGVSEYGLMDGYCIIGWK